MKISTPSKKIAQQIYLKRAGVAAQIFAKYADTGTVPTNLVNGGGIKPLSNQQQQPTAPKAPAAPKAPEAPTQPTQPVAPAVEPIPAGVPAPPVVPPPQSSTPPATNMATGTPITPGQPIQPAAPVSQNQPQPGTVSETGQITGQPAGQPPAEQAANPTNAQQAGRQPSGQPPTPLGEKELAQFDQITNQAEFQTAFEKLSPEQQPQVAQRWADKFFNSPENKPKVDGLRDLYSGDPQCAGSPAAKEAQAFVKNLPQDLQNKLSQENFQKFMAANPNATPQEQGNFMRQAWEQAGQSIQAMPWPAQLMMGLGLGAGLVGMFSSMFGEGGMESGLLGLLGIGAAGMIGANYGMFGNDARKMMGQGAVGLGRMMGMKIPDASQFDSKIIAEQKQKTQEEIMKAMDAAGANGGWAAGQEVLNKQLAPAMSGLNTLHSMGRDTGTTTLMGMLDTNDPQVAAAKYDELMGMREQYSNPDYLYNQATQVAQTKLDEAEKMRAEYAANPLWRMAGNAVGMDITKEIPLTPEQAVQLRYGKYTPVTQR